MSSIPQLLGDRRVWLVGLFALLTLALGRLMPGDLAIPAAVHSGYWVMLAALALFARAAWRVGRAAWRERPPGRVEAGALALVLAAGTVMLANEPQGFKILEDEVLLLGTSMGMHFDRDAAYPDKGEDADGPFRLIHHVLDKRPFFYPFLVALTHDFTGYRATNPFYVNGALGFVFLGLIWLLGRSVGGTAWAGALGVLLFAGLPLFAQQMAGGGMDLLNLTMLAAVALLARRWAEKRDAESLEALALGAVLLAYSRYESILFLAPVAALALWGWWKDGRVTLTWPTILAPALLLPWLWQNQVFTVNANAWEVAGHPETPAPFAWRYFQDNLGHALNFFFPPAGGYLPSSPLFAALGLLALPVFLVWGAQILARPGRSEPGQVALAACGAGLGAITLLFMLYFLGFDNYIVHRLSLPTYLLMALAILAVGKMIPARLPWGQVAVAVTVAALLTQGLPAMSKRAYEADYSPGVEMAWRQDFLRQHPERDYLFIDQDSDFWIVNEVSATPILQAKLHEDDLTFLLRNHSFSAIYVFQTFEVNPDTHEMRLLTPEAGQPSPDDLGPDFELETVAEHHFKTLFLGRISRVKAIQKDGKATPDTGFGAVSSGPPRSAEELEKEKAPFLEHWIKELP